MVSRLGGRTRYLGEEWVIELWFRLLLGDILIEIQPCESVTESERTRFRKGHSTINSRAGMAR